MVYLSQIQVRAEDTCAEVFPGQFVPRFSWASALVSEFYSSEVYAQRKIRAPNWGLWIECCGQGKDLPQMSRPYECRWPVDFKTYIKAESDHTKRSYMLQTIHEASVWVAKQNSWPADVFKHAHERVLERGLEFSGLVGKAYPSPDKRFTARIYCDYGLDWINYSVVLYRFRSKNEIAKMSLGKLRPAVGRLADDVKGGQWTRGKQFVLTSQFHDDWVADFSAHM